MTEDEIERMATAVAKAVVAELRKANTMVVPYVAPTIPDPCPAAPLYWWQYGGSPTC